MSVTPCRRPQPEEHDALLAKIKDTFSLPKELGDIPQRRAERRYCKYIVAGVCVALGFAAVLAAAILPRVVAVHFVEKYRQLIISDSLDDTVPKVRPRWLDFTRAVRLSITHLPSACAQCGPQLPLKTPVVGKSYGGTALDTLDEGEEITMWIPTIVNYNDHLNGAQVRISASFYCRGGSGDDHHEFERFYESVSGICRQSFERRARSSSANTRSGTKQNG